MALIGETNSWCKAVISVALAVLIAFASSMASSGASAYAANSYVTKANISYDLGSPPADPARNRLDIYLPHGSSPSPRPVVMFIHGGGWANGSKNLPSTPDKARLFSGLGYGFVSINYRLSPTSGDPGNPDPNRIMFPDHPDDVGEALGWLDRNAGRFGLDPDRIFVMGHSAGAHLASLVSTDPRYIRRYGVDRRQIIGTIPLDTAAFDIEQSILEGNPGVPSDLYMNAFGTPTENAATGSWAKASPLTWADPSDPQHLFLVENVGYRINRQLTMAIKLGQDSSSVVPLPLSHNGINQAIGNPSDTTQATSSVTSFISTRLAAYKRPKVKLTSRTVKGNSAVFRFTGSGNFSGFQCRIDSAKFKRCTSPRKTTVGSGKHRFQVRPLYPSGRHGQVKSSKFVARGR